jgi:D-tyrosyl-tRNA(Tyr) deacylase
MRVVIQRVTKASVKVGERAVGKIGPGFLVLTSVREGDSGQEVKLLAKKILELRIMADEKDHMNKSIIDVKGEILVVPQFTLYADTKRGRRPSFVKAARPEIAKKLIKKFIAELKKSGLRVEKGEFGARMEVELVNDGPVTIILD